MERMKIICRTHGHKQNNRRKLSKQCHDEKYKAPRASLRAPFPPPNPYAFLEENNKKRKRKHYQKERNDTNSYQEPFCDVLGIIEGLLHLVAKSKIRPFSHEKCAIKIIHAILPGWKRPSRILSGKLTIIRNNIAIIMNA